MRGWELERMKISLLTDAPKHNLALMKISTYHKQKGDEVFLNMPLVKADVSYASWLFENKNRYNATYTGGIGYNPRISLPEKIEKCKPDSLFNLNHSLDTPFGLVSESALFVRFLYCHRILLTTLFGNFTTLNLIRLNC